MPTAEDPGSLPLVIGLGNDARRDDGVGLAVVRSLARTPETPARLVEGPGDASALLELWTGVERVIVIDAVRSGRPAGTIVRLEVGASGLPGDVPATSTHGLSLAEAVGLGRALDRLPRSLVVYGIETGSLDAGEGLTPPVAEAVPRVRERILAELAAPAPAPRARTAPD